MNPTLLNATNVSLTPSLGTDNVSVVITATQTIPQADLTAQLAQVQNQIAQLTNQLANQNARAAALQGYLALIPAPVVSQPVTPAS